MVAPRVAILPNPPSPPRRKCAGRDLSGQWQFAYSGDGLGGRRRKWEDIAASANIDAGHVTSAEASRPGWDETATMFLRASSCCRRASCIDLSTSSTLASSLQARLQSSGFHPFACLASAEPGASGTAVGVAFKRLRLALGGGGRPPYLNFGFRAMQKTARIYASQVPAPHGVYLCCRTRPQSASDPRRFGAAPSLPLLACWWVQTSARRLCLKAERNDS
jgi:hypothetical protein